MTVALMTAACLLTMTTPSVRAGRQDPLASADRTAFPQWLAALMSEARERGFPVRLVERTLAGVRPLQRVVDNDRQQAELKVGFDQYYARRVTGATVARGRTVGRRHRAVLARIGRAFGVQPKFVVAVWGLESQYGRVTGRTPIFEALATLAWEPRRAGFFREQLFDALTIASSGDVALERMHGSWAGAMGQPQFLPSSYLAYAVDFDGDGKRDIWTSTADVLASIANYLSVHGWQDRWTWGREVTVPAAARARLADIAPQRPDGCYAKRNMTERLALDRWREIGVRRADGGPLPDAAIDASLVQTDSRSFLVYDNYDALLDYNCAHYYALSVALLADRLD